jgi:hypothetical protein
MQPPPTSDDDEDDGQPYRAAGAASEAHECCPSCKRLLPAGAILCNHCGFNRQTGTTLQRVHEKAEYEWEPSPAFAVRFGVFLAVQGIAMGATIAVAMAEGGLAVAWLAGALLFAYLLGTFPRLHLTRTKKGRIRLRRIWRIAFIPLAPSEIRWSEYSEVLVTHGHETGFLDWLIVLFLVPFCLIPAILWWFYVINPDHYDVVLTQIHGAGGVLVFRGRDQAAAHEIASTIRKVTGLG